MPLGGYCETCGRWVWVNGYGECQFGHPASVVRDVQQLRPAEQAGQQLAPIDQALTLAVARRQRTWWWRHSLWLFWTFTLGFLNWLAFFYIGVKARRIEWIVSGFAYLIPVILTVGFYGTSFFWLFFAIQLAVSAISVLHALLVRPQYRALMFGDGAAARCRRRRRCCPRSTVPALPRGFDEGVAEIIRDAEAKIDEILAAAQAITDAERARQGRQAVHDGREDHRRAARRAAARGAGARLPHVLSGSRAPDRHAATPTCCGEASARRRCAAPWSEPPPRSTACSRPSTASSPTWCRTR